MSFEDREYVADWLRRMPLFAELVGIDLGGDLASRLNWLGSGGRAVAIFLGEQDGEKRVLKITSDSAQAAMSQLAMRQRPEGVVPIYEVVQSSQEPKSMLPELPKKGEDPFYVDRTWGIVEKLVVPIDALRLLGATSVAGRSPDELVALYSQTWRVYESGHPARDPDVEAWRRLYASAIEWVYEACEIVGSTPNQDLHEGNWGVDPDTGELLLIDLGQCHAIREAR